MMMSSYIMFSVGTGVREGIVLGGRKKFATKITLCPKI